MFMWILMGWSYGNADYNIYLSRYNNSNSFKTLEPVYTTIQNIAKGFGAGYEYFLIICSGLCLLIRFYIIIRSTVSPNLVISLYLLFPFIVDIVQIRFFYASTIILVGWYIILFSNKKRKYVYFVALVFFATLIHNSCLVYIVFIFIDRIEKYIKQIPIVALTLVCGMFALLSSGVLYKVLYFVASLFNFQQKFKETFIANQNAYSLNDKVVYILEMLLAFFMINLICKKTKQLLRHSDYVIYLCSLQNETRYLNFCYNANYIFLLLIPLVWFSGDIYRIQHSFFLLIYILCSAVRPKNNVKKFVIQKGTISLKVITLCLAIFFMILFELLLVDLRTTVFIPTFFENRLF